MILPLCRAVGVYVSDERWRGQGFCGKDSSLELDPKAHDGVANEGHLCCFCVDHLSSQSYGTGSQRHYRNEKQRKTGSQIVGRSSSQKPIKLIFALIGGQYVKEQIELSAKLLLWRST